MALVSLNRMALLDVNYIMTTAHTWKAPTDYTVVSGFSETSLSDDDATTMFRTATVGASPIITIDFGTAMSVTAFGMCNHNLTSAGYSTVTLSRSSDDISYTSVGAYTLPGKTTDTGSSVDPNRDFAMLFDAANYRYWRVALSPTGANFQIGYMYIGKYYEFARNPSDGEWIESYNPTTRYIQSAGGMSHAIKGMTYRPRTLEMSFGRARSADMQRILGNTRTDYIIGVIPPEAAPSPQSAPRGTDVFWGRIGPHSSAPRTPGNVTLNTEVYDVTINMIGAV